MWDGSEISLQILEAFEDNNRIYRFDCVTGDSDHPTNRGHFKIIRKENPYRSKTYNVQMDYALFFTQDGKAIHQYHGIVSLATVRMMRNKISDWFGSHGCVRLSEVNARTLFRWANIGTAVEVE
jgi:lipoprotein-anchoring transpeptidase ErfK/SrfK